MPRQSSSARRASAPAPILRWSILDGFGSMVVEGVAWGAASSIGHKVVDAVMGPRAIHVESAVPSAPVGSDQCKAQSKAFQDCINNNLSDIGKCQFYIDKLNECRRGSATAVRA